MIKHRICKFWPTRNNAMQKREQSKFRTIFSEVSSFVGNPVHKVYQYMYFNLKVCKKCILMWRIARTNLRCPNF